MSIAGKLIRVADNQKRVFDAGYEKGKSESGGFEEGKAAAYDEFWDAYQQNGNRLQYNYAFNGHGWTDSIFKPKYVLPAISHCVHMFSYAVNLTEIDHVLDFSASSSGLNNTFAGSTALKSIKKIIVGKNTSFTSAFYNCTALENVIFEGIIGKGGLDFSSCKSLSASSLLSIIEALSPDVSGLAITLPTTAKSNYEAVYGEVSWDILLSTHTNWTIAYA